MLEQIKKISDIKNLNVNELQELAIDIRKFLIDNVSVTGGHLASNLGVVELTLALFKNFDFDNDKIVFDVGHQCYTYKILTDRKNQMKSLRKYKGISGFPKINESKYDFFNTGHASNSISAALGMARARDLSNEKYNVIAFLGDGALTGGMTFEAINDVGFKKTNMIIILNDNGMAISNNVGSLSSCLNQIRINSFYNNLKRKAHYKLDKMHSKKMTNMIRKVKNRIKSFLLPSMYFENLGVSYIGPIDGHDFNKLNKVFLKAKNMEGPIVIHVKTVKGKGYEFAEKYPNIYHGVGAFCVENGANNNNELTYSNKFGQKLVELAENNKKIVAITAAMKDGTGLNMFADKYPERFFDVGICEEHAVTFSAGLATSGFKPFFAVYSTFLQRGFDQLIVDVCMQNLPVTVMVDRSGIVGEDGETHHGIFDNSYLSLIPNLTIMQPKCVQDLDAMLEFACDFDKPLVIKYPKGKSTYKFKKNKKINYGKWEIVSKGEKVAIIATGRMVELAMKIKEKIKKNILVVNAQFIKPIDEKLINNLIKKDYKIFVLEENTINGGLGSLIKIKCKGDIELIGIDDKFVEHGTISELLYNEGLCIEQIIKLIRKKL